MSELCIDLPAGSDDGVLLFDSLLALLDSLLELLLEPLLELLLLVLLEPLLLVLLPLLVLLEQARAKAGRLPRARALDDDRRSSMVLSRARCHAMPRDWSLRRLEFDVTCPFLPHPNLE